MGLWNRITGQSPAPAARRSPCAAELQAARRRGDDRAALEVCRQALRQGDHDRAFVEFLCASFLTAPDPASPVLDDLLAWTATPVAEMVRDGLRAGLRPTVQVK